MHPICNADHISGRSELKMKKVTGSIISTTYEDGKENASWSISNIEALNEIEFENMMTEAGLFVCPSNECEN
jgi:hypothetical protein